MKKRNLFILGAIIVFLLLLACSDDSSSVGTEQNRPPLKPYNPIPVNGMIDHELGYGTLEWSCSDPDGDSLLYDVYFDDKVKTNLKATKVKCYLGDGLRDYYWKIVAKDNHGHITEGDLWKFTTKAPDINNPPLEPSNPSPADGLTDLALSNSLYLGWECSDPENDLLGYDLYYGTANPPALLAENITATNYQILDLAPSTTYYWQIIARDDHGNSTEGAIWSFTTKAPDINNPPLEPFNPSPADGLTDLALSNSLDLGWECSDPENDPLVYDLYYGTENPPALLAENITATNYQILDLAPSTTYYWQIIARDDYGNSTEGAIWSFTTINGGGGSSSIEMALIPSGSFDMGNHYDGEGEDRERPIHNVVLNSFYAGNYEIKQSEWEDIMGSNPAAFEGENRPVERVSWYAILVFCNKLSMKDGYNPCYTINGSSNPDDWGNIPNSDNQAWNAVICDFNATGYRLPTEAEWEYAARGGISGKRFPRGETISHEDNADEQATYNSYWVGNDPSEVYDHTLSSGTNPNYENTAPVGSFWANGYGLCDMSGNVYELCWDLFDPNYYSSSPANNPTGPGSGAYRVMRGGSWGFSATHCRVSYRNAYAPKDGEFNVGFRVVRTAK